MINSPRQNQNQYQDHDRDRDQYQCEYQHVQRNISQLHLNYEYQSTTKMSYQSTTLMPHQFSRVFTEVETFRQKWHIRIIHILREI